MKRLSATLPRAPLRAPTSYLFAAVLAGVFLPPAVPVAGAEGEGEKARPNVLFIAIDDLNDWIGALGGHPQAKTPRIDSLAARGVLFTRAYCTAPACNPSRVSLLCGVRPSTSGVYHNQNPWRKALPDAVTLPQHFTASGYAVAGCGKIFHGTFPDRASWQEYFRPPADPRPQGAPLNGLAKAAHFDWGPIEGDDAQMSDARVVDWAIEHLGRPRSQPFFLAVGLARPHLPWYVPRKYFTDFPPEKVTLPRVAEDDLADVPPAGVQIARPDGDHRRVVESKNWEKAVAAYLASIAFTDGQVGRLIDALDARKLATETVIVFWGDHGWHLGEKKHWRKFTLWEEATRVPLVICAPGVALQNARCGRTVSLLDVYPTLIELCGLPPRDGLEGRSLAPLLKDPGVPWDRPAVITHGRGNHAVRSERWRYIRYADGTEELYDHEADPMEWTNLAGRDDLAEVKAAKAQLRAWLPQKDAEEVKRRAAGG